MLNCPISILQGLWTHFIGDLLTLKLPYHRDRPLNPFALTRCFFNYIRTTLDPECQNPCDTPVPRKVFKQSTDRNLRRCLSVLIVILRDSSLS
jgi:hypothetical protein